MKRAEMIKAIDSFLNGMGSLNIFGGSSIYNRYSSPNRTDYEAIKKDWEKVGADMKDANNSYSRNYIPKLKEQNNDLPKKEEIAISAEGHLPKELQKVIDFIDTVYEEWLTDGSNEQTLGEAIADELIAKEVTDEEIIASIPYPEAISKHQTDINIGWIRCRKWYRDKIKQL